MKKKIASILTLSLALGFLSSCLDDKGYTDVINSENNKAVISLFGNEPGVFPTAVQISASEDVALTITASKAVNDLTVTLKKGTAAQVEAYNEELKAAAIEAGDTTETGEPIYTEYIMLPDSVYTIPSLTVTIPKGTLDADFVFPVNSLKMTLDLNYLIPFEIESVSGDPNAVIADNLKSVLLNVQLKNRFDGVYKTEGKMVDITSASLTGYYPWETALVTTGANQVLLYDNEGILGTPGHVIKSGDAFSSYGEFGLIINFDANNVVTSVANYYGDPSPTRARSAVLDPSGENKYDAATKTLKIKYWMYQGGSMRTSFDETYTFKEARE